MALDARTLSERGLWRTLVVIVVLVGTNPYSFERLVKKVDELANANSWDVFIQLGNTAYVPRHCDFERFITKDELVKKISAADAVICHGGFGSIRDVLACGKPVIAVPRKPQLGESNDVQEELVRELEKEGRVLAVYDIERLQETIELAKSFVSSGSPGHRIPQLIQEFLTNQLVG
jgi:UDP-N-acetylglucosamine transferase subunit ALG13